VAHYQSRPLHPFNNIRHGEGLAAAGDTEQGLFPLPGFQILRKCIYSLRLVAGHAEIGDYLEWRHSLLIIMPLAQSIHIVVLTPEAENFKLIIDFRVSKTITRRVK
jgi:hypothetical protein